MATQIQQHHKAIKQKEEDFAKTITSARRLIKEAWQIRHAICKEGHALEYKREKKRKADEILAAAAPKKQRTNGTFVKTKKRKIAQPKKPKAHKPKDPVADALASMPKDRRSPKPTGIKNKGNMCYSNSVLQGFGVVIDPDWFGAVLGRHCILPIREFLYVLDNTCLKTDDGKARDPIVFQRLIAQVDSTFNGDRQEDATEWFRLVMEVLAYGAAYRSGTNIGTGNPIIEALFRVNEGTTRQCRTCKNQAWINNDMGDWMLTVGEGNDLDSHTYTINNLLDIKAEAEHLEGYKCESCRNLGSVKQWRGLRNLPEVLAIKFDRTTVSDEVDAEGRLKEIKKDYVVNPEVMLDMAEYSINDKTRTKYELKALVRHIGESLEVGHYITYVHDEGHHWWKCNDSHVSSSNLNAAKQGPIAYKKNGTQIEKGDIAMAFYQRIGVPPSSAAAEDSEEEYSEEEHVEVSPQQPVRASEPIADKDDAHYDTDGKIKGMDEVLEETMREVEKVIAPGPRHDSQDVVALGPRVQARSWYEPCRWLYQSLPDMQRWATYGEDI